MTTSGTVYYGLDAVPVTQPTVSTRSSAIAEGPCDVPCQLKHVAQMFVELHLVSPATEVTGNGMKR